MMLHNLHVWFVFLLVCGASAFTTSAPAPTRTLGRTPIHSNSHTTGGGLRMSTTTAPPDTDTDTDKRTRRQGGEDEQQETFDEFDIRKQGPLEYLEDDLEESRDLNDPFHILLLAETYLKPKVSINYVSGSLQFVLEMPYEDAVDAAQFAKDNGMSCLGTWSREECLKKGKELQMRDLCVRVVPFVPGGKRGWQAGKDAADGDFGNEFIDADYRIE